MAMTLVNSKDYFKVNKILYIAIVLGQVALAGTGVLLKLMGRNGLAFYDMRDTMLWVAPVVVGAGYLASIFIYNKLIDSSKAQANLLKKMSRYRIALIARYAVLEIGSFAAGIGFLMTADLIFLGILLLNIIYFLIIPPSRANAINDLELNPNEEQMVNDPDAIIAEMKNAK